MKNCLTKFICFTLFYTLFSSFILPVYAQNKQAQQTPSKNWVVNCSTRADTTLQCALRQVLRVKKTGQIVLIAQVSKKTAKDLPELSFRLPHNVLLQKGVSFSIDKDKKRVLPIIRADQNGSYAGLKLEGSLISRLRTGKAMNVLLYSTKGQGINFKLPLSGFAAASKHLK